MAMELEKTRLARVEAERELIKERAAAGTLASMGGQSP